MRDQPSRNGGIPSPPLVIENWPIELAEAETKPALRDFRFINTVGIDSYLNQLGNFPTKRRQKKEFGFGASGPKFTWSAEDGDGTVSVEDRITRLLSALEDRALVTGRRPRRLPRNSNFKPPLVHEHCFATQYLMPITPSLQKNGIYALKLWISEPQNRDFVDEPFDWSGSYLFLTELGFDGREYGSMISGCSALRMVYNATGGNPLYYCAGQEILGRWDKRPLSDKLVDFGAVRLETVEIECLYSIRYMSDEQFHPEAPQDGRVHDILGYPLFIAT